MPGGRHSSPDQLHFYKSVAAWFLPWVLIAVVVGTAVWIAVEAVSGATGGSSSASATASATPEPTEEPEPTAAPATPSPEATEPSAEPTPEPTKEPKEDEAPLITEGVTVQVLNATELADADDRMADKLSKLGFTVVAVESASSRYEETTVFWSTDASQEAAERLADKFGWVAEAKPENLSTTVSLHVVVGADEA
ncbi:MAG TPA: LytR C-terminal domain-containing protein [Actinomycetota bacterium]|nr:LytR C-terminal domain-containing protein [Actinomycetota bacterium]